MMLLSKSILVTMLLGLMQDPQLSDLTRFPVSVQPRVGRDITGTWHKYHCCDGVDGMIVWLRSRRDEVTEQLKTDDYAWYLREADLHYQYKVLDQWCDSWVYLREAADRSNYGAGRLQYMFRLRETIGPVNYYLGIMPRPDGEIFTLTP